VNTDKEQIREAREGEGPPVSEPVGSADLLEEETDYAAWTRYVRILRPAGRSIVVPRRFVLPTRQREEDQAIDLDVIDLALGLLGER